MNSFKIQCITEGLQMDKAGLSTKIQSQLIKTNDFLCENRHASGLQVSIKHFMCTLSDEMELVRNLGHKS